MNSTSDVIFRYSPTIVGKPVSQADSNEENKPIPPAQATQVPNLTDSRSIPVNRSGNPTPGQITGFVLLAVGLGGLAGPLIPALRLESAYAVSQLRTSQAKPSVTSAKPASAPVYINPLIAMDGSAITPVNTDFSVIIPGIGVNAPVIANVDPTSPATYDSALLQGVAQSSTSFTPDQNGTTYLFSHSTNYDWFVKDLNAVFYLLKNLKVGDYVVLYYKGKQYTYQIRETKIVSPTSISYLVPTGGKKGLILETCWPPGTTTERQLVFADLIQEH